MCSFISILRMRCLALVIALSLAVSLTSCSASERPRDLLARFCDEYGLFGEILSPSFSEGETGYVDEDFFGSVFLESADSVEDYAVIFLSSPKRISECSVLLCYSDHDAILAVEMLRRRVAFLKAAAVDIDSSYLSDAAVFKCGKYAVMCVLSDNKAAERIWRKIL